ncbi:LuxR C-terminal-related transcriptional regulator [Maribellus sediminis]|uniref:LuxR C-terminal-related transcriptional regulator n=1 Tax=Maribellus sediminis TaxID=2696285 RepID=UPI0014315B53|nr:response regulator transcription factor [Maribellus sediminis]
MCKILILENYSLFCSGIKPVLEKSKEFQVMAVAKEIREFISIMRKAKPDVIIVDLLHCEDDGISVIKRIRAKTSKAPILLIVSKDYADRFESYIALGVNGIIFNSSDPEKLVKAVKRLMSGEDFFSSKIWILLKEHLRTKRQDIMPVKETKSIITKRELDVLKLFCKGYTYKEIGYKLDISPRTVETHKKNIASKINVRSTAEMVEFAVHNGLI